MKHKILPIFVVLSCIITLTFTSCEDEVFSKLHEYTEEEQAYRDSIEAAKAGVKADFIVTQDVELTYGNWSSVDVPLDVATMCEKLGYADTESLQAAIGAFDGDVKLYAVNPATGADFTDHVVDEAGVQEGFVFATTGEPGAAWDWPETATDQLYNMWCVYNVNNLAFTMGMRTGVLEAGTTYKIILLWKKGDYRLAMIFNITPEEAEEEDPNAYVADQILTKDVTLVSSSIDENALVVATLDGASLAGALGYPDAATLSVALGNVEWNTQVNYEVQFFGVNITTGVDYTDSYTAGMGYWYTAEGDVCTFADENAALYVNLDPATLSVTIGQKGGQVANGETYKLVVMFANADNYRVAMELNITTVVDTPPEGVPYELSVTQTVMHKINGDWTQSYVDVTSLMRDAFKMTTAEINAAIADKTMTFYAIEPDQSQKPSTSDGADYPGHWINADGTVATNWADGEIFVQMVPGSESIQFMFLNQPSNLTEPTTITVKQVAELNGGKINFTFNVELVAEDVAAHTIDYARNVQHTLNADWASTYIDVTEVLSRAFQMSANEIAAAITDQTMEFYAIEPDNSHKPSTADGGDYPGHWINADGTVATNWSDGEIFSQMQVSGESIKFMFLNQPTNLAEPATVSVKQTAILNGGQVNFTFTVNVISE